MPFMSGELVSELGVLQTIALDAGTPVPAEAVFIAGVAHAVTGERYVCPLPASASDYKFIGGIAVRNDGAMCISTSAVAEVYIAGVGVSETGELIATEVVSGVFIRGILVNAAGGVVVSDGGGGGGGAPAILLEDGSYLLLEDSSHILLE